MAAVEGKAKCFGYWVLYDTSAGRSSLAHSPSYSSSTRNLISSLEVCHEIILQLSVLGLRSEVLVAGGLQGWLLRAAARSFPHV